MAMVEPSKQTRILCKETGRLIATTNEFGVSIWCIYTKKPEIIPWEQFFTAYERIKGEGIQNKGDSDDTTSTTVA